MTCNSEESLPSTTKQLERPITLDHNAAQRLANPETLKHVVFESRAHRETNNPIAPAHKSCLIPSSPNSRFRQTRPSKKVGIVIQHADLN